MRLFLLIASCFTSAFAANYLIHHRVFHPSLPLQPYRQRGLVSLDSSIAEFVPSSNLTEDLIQFSEILRTVERPSDSLYQVALQSGDEQVESVWDFSSVPVCHLSKTAFETIVIYTTGGQGPRPFALDYFVSPTPHDGMCPKSKSQEVVAPATSLKRFSKHAQHLNTTVLLQGTDTPPLPELKAPPPLTPEGEVVKPVPEKSFIQKYWLYIGAVLLVLVLSGGAEEEPPKRK